MDSEEKALLKEIKAAVSQNNEMLKKLVHYQKVAIWTKFAYWTFVILLALGAFALLKPVFQTLGDIYGIHQDGLLNVFNNPSAIKEFKEQLQ